MYQPSPFKMFIKKSNIPQPIELRNTDQIKPLSTNNEIASQRYQAHKANSNIQNKIVQQPNKQTQNISMLISHPFQANSKFQISNKNKNPQQTNKNQINFLNSKIPKKQVIFPINFYLLSRFPCICPKDQIYLTLINRLQNPQTIYFIHDLYINIKFLCVQSRQQFWEYIYHLYLLSQKSQEKCESSKLRLSLQSCLMNFTVKQFNKAFYLDEKQKITNCNKKLQRTVFNTKGFKNYQNLMQTVFQFYLKLLKTQNDFEKQMVLQGWYIDTVKAIDLCIIYGNRQPQKIKNLIKLMFNLNPQAFIKDFKSYLVALQQYLTDSTDNRLLILQLLQVKVQVSSNNQKQNHYINTKRIVQVCSECLKIFMHICSIFKFFPSFVKLICFDSGLQLFKIIIKIAKKVIFNLNAKDSIWKVSDEVKQRLSNMKFTLMDKIVQMFKYIFLNVKNALFQTIQQSKKHKQLTKQLKERQKIIKKMYKRLIKELLNRKKQQPLQYSKIFSDKISLSISFSSSNIIPSNLLSQQTYHKINQSKYFVLGNTYHQYGKLIIRNLIRKQLSKHKDFESNEFNEPLLYKIDFFTYYSTDDSFVQHFIVLKQFQNLIRQNIIQQRQFQKRHNRIIFNFKQIPSISEYKRQLQEQSHNQFLKKLNSSNKEYEDEPTQQQYIKNYMKSDETIEDVTQIDWENNIYDQIEQIKSQRQTKKNKQKTKNIDDDILSPEQINQSQFLIENSCLNSSQSQSNRSRMNMSIHGVNSQQKVTTNLSNISNISKPRNIFRIKDSLKIIRQSMIREQLQYFERYKNLSWHQISSISVAKKLKRHKNDQSSSNESSLFSNQKQSLYLQIKDMGLSFDMVLNDQQNQSENNNISRHSHFYYNILQKNSKYGLKSFMQDYQFSNFQSNDVSMSKTKK